MAAIAFAASPVVGTKLATRNPRVSRRTRAAPTTRAAASTTTKSISQTFVDLKKRNQCAFVPFICAGDPNLDATEKAVRILDDAGADIIELGVPYSDPLADGPTIQVRGGGGSRLGFGTRFHGHRGNAPGHRTGHRTTKMRVVPIVPNAG
tara:strand:+ start:2648 stop:3097 length:450 start_codon:yes stop_codon:yes gene_type:complete